MSKFNTLDSLKDKEGGGHSSEGEDSDEGRQGFYVGGSERSGQQVLGPNRDEIAGRLFDAVRRAGAEQLSAEEAAQARDRSARAHSGYRLGSINEANQPMAAPGVEPASGPIIVRVILWENGFSVDDGPLRSFEDPESMAFMMALKKGAIPRELELQHRGRAIDLHMERRPTPYVPPKPKPFASQGMRLGSIVPGVAGAGSSSSTVPAAELPSAKLGSDDAKKLLEEAQKAVNVQDDKPKGQIQIRQPNGERIIGEFNSDHLVEDVRSFIVAALPDYAFQPFQLHTIYPKKAIDDEKQTVSEAGIFKAVVAMVKI